MDSKGENSCGCHADESRAIKDPAYRKALWIVVILNLGFGIAEMIGGFIAQSQALKADALDFIGDGSITFIGLIALGWSKRIRAHIAQAQGWFLLTLGLGIIGMSIWRISHAIAPEAELMGGIGVVALLINITSAMVLVRFKDKGDSNARAIWLFSRNDALANVAVIIAALLVGWSKTAWPDLIVAGLIAALFIHSAWEIIGDSRAEIRETSSV